MTEPSFIDDMDFDITGDFFDHIDDLLDFPSEDVDGGLSGGDCNGFQGISPVPPTETLASYDDGFSANSNCSSSELPTELSVPQEDIAQLEWLSNFVEDSFSAGSIPLDVANPNNYHLHNHCNITAKTTIKNTNTTKATIKNTNTTNTTTTTITTTTNNNKDSHKFRTSSPVSVLESSSSSSGGKSTLLGSDTVIPGRARSKRPRPATFNPRPVHPLISPTSSLTERTPQFSEFAFDIGDSHLANRILKPTGFEEKKRKKKKLPSWSEHSESAPQQIGVRKCLHCEITKTPQWRAGPLGPKTLCNACGVRYKSGRLFPEYRPAASPTFVASIHSNSHKKVLEMRVKGDNYMEGGSASAMTPPPEFLPRSSYMNDYI